MKLFLKLLLILLALGILFSDAGVKHFHYAQSPYLFNDDSRMWIPPFYKYQADGPQGEDYISDYFLRALNPTGYQTLYILVAKLWNPDSFSKLLPYLEWLILAACLGLIAWKLGGPAMCFCTLALILSTPVFLERMIGGLPRSFGYPLLSMALAAFFFGRVYFLATITLLGAAFYPVVSVISGIWLALLLMPAVTKIQGEVVAWSLKKRFIVIICTAGLSAVLALPLLFASVEYGGRISPSENQSFPEAGVGGRYGKGDRPPFNGFLAESQLQIVKTLLGSGAPFIERMSLRLTKKDHGFSLALNIAIAVAVLTICGTAKMALTYPPAFRLLLALSGVAFGHLLAHLAYPHLFLPPRYIVLTIPLFIVTLFPCALYSLINSAQFLKNRNWFVSSIVISVVAVVLLLFGGQGNGSKGYKVETSGQKNLYSFIKKLPADTIIAGWPGGLIDNVFYLTKRKTFLSLETHQAFHKKYTQGMRERMSAIIDAYFALDSKSLKVLRDKYGVQYFLIDRNLSIEGNNFTRFNAPFFNYFQPFRQMVIYRLNQVRGKEFILTLKLNEVAVFREDPWILIDLSKIK
jgi:hypothetical protein